MSTTPEIPTEYEANLRLKIKQDLYNVYGAEVVELRTQLTELKAIADMMSEMLTERAYLEWERKDILKRYAEWRKKGQQ